jgi:hypothetical protein
VKRVLAEASHCAPGRQRLDELGELAQQRGLGPGPDHPHEHEQFIAHLRGLLALWVADEARGLRGSR